MRSFLGLQILGEPDLKPQHFEFRVHLAQERGASLGAGRVLRPDQLTEQRLSPALDVRAEGVPVRPRELLDALAQVQRQIVAVGNDLEFL
jgi:hypothetical protein